MADLEAVVRRFFEQVWNQGNVVAAGDFLAAEFTSHNAFDVTILGPDRYGRAVLDYRAAFPDLTVTLEDVFASGDRVYSGNTTAASAPTASSRSVVGVGVAEHPAGAVDVEDHRQRAGGAGRFDDAHPHRAGRAALDADPFLVDRRLLYVAGLDLVDGLAAFRGGHLIQERRGIGGLAELDSLGLEHRFDLCHGCLL